MADQTNPTGGNTIDLRTPQTSTPQTGAPAAGGSAAQTAGGQTTGDDLFSKFEIPEFVREQYSDLIPLILQTESMNDEERQYWFQILPIMTDEQVAKLREILANEKKQLEQLDKEYQQDLKRVNDKHVSEWKEFESKEKRKQLKAAEGATEVKEKQEEEDLLKKLQNL